MSIQQALLVRSNESCELCSSTEQLEVFEVPFSDIKDAQSCIIVCNDCYQQIDGTKELDMNRWRCLSDCMWSPEPAVQVMSWRMLNRLSTETWALDLLDMLYLDDEVLQWAAKDLDASGENPDGITVDSNGAQLNTGDTVILIKDLDVKGTGFTAKRGTAVRNISLTDNPNDIEGKVNGTRIVLCAKFLKKS